MIILSLTVDKRKIAVSLVFLLGYGDFSIWIEAVAYSLASHPDPKLIGLIFFATRMSEMEPGPPEQRLHLLSKWYCSSIKRMPGEGKISESEIVEVKLIPYFGWANRGENEIMVWMRQR